jgi:putative ABC transport system substrate-binding protein
MEGAEDMLNLIARENDAPSAPNAFGSNRRDWKYFDEKLSELRINDVENIIARGRLLIEANDELERGSYEATVKRHFDLSYARKLRIIAAVGAGFVESMARPGGNTTGFISFEYAIGAKWLELLKEIAPNVTRAAVLRDSTLASGIGQFAAIQAVGPVGMELSVIGLHDAGAIEHAVAAFARGSNGGLVVTAAPFPTNHPDVIPALAARYKLPAVYPFRYYGGLISYGPDTVSQFGPAASYVDRILKGEKPADLPVQAPTKYELVINLKAAKALGLDVPATLLARADVIE